MSPAVNFGDSGEFIAAAATLSNAHAPGYPLLALLGHSVGTLLPLATWAYRVNFVSVLSAACALAFFWDAMRRTGLPVAAAAAGTLFLGLSPLWLHTSLQTEVFALNGLCAAAALWIFCRYWEGLFESRPMALLGLVLGLGGANHHTLILVVPALLVAGALSSRPRPRDTVRGLLYLLGFGFLGLAVYFYLPIRARAFPPLDWGHPVDLSSFLHVLLRRDYGSFSLTVEGAQAGRLAGIPAQTMRCLSALYAGFGPAGCALAALGLWAWITRKQAGSSGPPWHCAVLWALLSGPAFLWLGNPPFDPQTTGALQRFYLLSWFGAAWLAAFGTGWVYGLGRWGRTAASALLLVPATTAFLGAKSWNQRWDLAAHDYGRNVLRSLPRGAAFFIDGGDDTFYTTAYNQFAQGLRTDVEVHDRGGLVFPNPYGGDFRRITPEAKEKRRRRVEAAYASVRPVFYSTLRDEIFPGMKLGSWGLLRSIDNDVGRLHMWDLYPRRHSRTLADAHYRYRALVPVYPMMRAAEAALRGEYAAVMKLMRLAFDTAPDVKWVRNNASLRAQWAGYQASRRKDWFFAEEAYLFAAKLRPEDVENQLNLGVAREKQGRLREAEAAYRKGLEIEPDSFQALFNLGALHWKRGEWDEASRTFERALRLRPNDRSVQSFAVRARAKAGKSK